MLYCLWASFLVNKYKYSRKSAENQFSQHPDYSWLVDLVEFGRGHFFYQLCDRTQAIIGSTRRQTTFPERLGQGLWGQAGPQHRKTDLGARAEEGGGERAGATEEVCK